MRIAMVLLAISSTPNIANALAEGVADLADITIADEIRTAFLEKAPQDLSLSMRKAVVTYCSRTGAKATSLCGRGELYFLRSVLVTGKKTNVGYVCAVASIDSTLTYFTEDMLYHSTGCAKVSYDMKGKAHFLKPTDDRGQ